MDVWFVCVWVSSEVDGGNVDVCYWCARGQRGEDGFEGLVVINNSMVNCHLLYVEIFFEKKTYLVSEVSRSVPKRPEAARRYNMYSR